MRSNFNYDTHNFIFINTFAQNKITLEYQNNKEKIKDIIDYLNNINSNFKIRYIPFCFVNKSLHNKVFNYLHHFFDQDDWFPGIVYYKDYKKLNKTSVKKLASYRSKRVLKNTKLKKIILRLLIIKQQKKCLLKRK